MIFSASLLQKIITFFSSLATIAIPPILTVYLVKNEKLVAVVEASETPIVTISEKFEEQQKTETKEEKSVEESSQTGGKKRETKNDSETAPDSLSISNSVVSPPVPPQSSSETAPSSSSVSTSLGVNDSSFTTSSSPILPAIETPSVISPSESFTFSDIDISSLTTEELTKTVKAFSQLLSFLQKLR